MEHKNIEAIAGGMVGTAVITAMMFLLSLFGLPQINFGVMLSQLTDSPLFVGWLLHFLVGTGLAFLYVYYFREFLPGPYAIKGLVFSVLPWVVSLIMLFPMVDTLIPGEKPQQPGVLFIGIMFSYLVYGLVMGQLVRPHAMRHLLHPHWHSAT